MSEDPDSRSERVTIYDVAREVGVAPSTVSRAFSRPGRVSADTHARVMAAAQRLGYRTGPPAAQQRTGNQRRLGIEMPDITNPYFAEVVAGMQEAAHELQYLLLLLDSAEDQERERAGILQTIDAIDGIVLSGTRMSDATVAQLVKRRPVVVLNRHIAGIDSVVPDIAHGSQQAVAHLAENGAGSLVYVAGPMNSWSDAERWRTIRDAAQQRGLVARRIGPVPPTAGGGEAAFAQLRGRLPDAVIAYNDLVAIGVLGSALRAGIAVPGRLAVIGHDDIPIARLVGTGLTTVASPKRAQGRLAIERLVRRVESSAPMREPVTGVLPVKLVERGSTGPRDRANPGNRSEPRTGESRMA